MTWIKICGITNFEDAAACAAAGADALGFVFAPSPRRIAPEAAATIVARLHRRPEKVGVFVNESAQGISAIARQAGLTAAQMHGAEPPAAVTALHALAPELALFKALSGAGSSAQLAPYTAPEVSRCLRAIFFDSGAGGSGHSFVWRDEEEFIRSLNGKPRVVIAGGLTPENVSAALGRFRPWGVDVSTGVESAPGKKDPARVRAFIAAVRAAERANQAGRAS